MQLGIRTRQTPAQDMECKENKKASPRQSVARSKNPGPIFFNLVLNPSYHLTIALIGTSVFSSTVPDPTKLEIKLNKCFTTCSARRPGSAALVPTITAPFPLAPAGSGSAGAIWDKGSIAIPRIAVTSPPTVGLASPANATGPALAPGAKVPRNRKMADGLSFESLAKGGGLSSAMVDVEGKKHPHSQ